MRKEAPPGAWYERQSLGVAPLLPTLTSPGFYGAHAHRVLLPGPPRVSPPLLPPKTVWEQTVQFLGAQDPHDKHTETPYISAAPP